MNEQEALSVYNELNYHLERTYSCPDDSLRNESEKFLSDLCSASYAIDTFAVLFKSDLSSRASNY